jgi:hypothetical protein
MATFRIPKQTDRTLLQALVAVQDDLKELVGFQIYVLNHDPGGNQIQLPDTDPEKAESIAYILAEESEVFPWLSLRINNNQILMVHRRWDQVTDEVTCATDQNAINQIPADRRPQAVVKLIASARKHLRAANVEASLRGGSDSEWTRYRDSQLTILSSLEETQRSIMSEFTRKSLEWEDAAQTRLNEREAELRNRFKSSEDELARLHQAKMEELTRREQAIESREKAFNTKEARYVARNEQQKQIDQIKGWLEGWSLTKGTTSKRYIVAVAYIFGAVATGLFTIWFSYENLEILRVAQADLSRVPWWQWLVLALRAIIPLAAFITFVIYFIRWSSEWARQHADEEFRNRTRVLDIGRSAWLLEAVRDAQENQKEIPVDLLKELSRNLFAYTAPADIADLHPQAVTDLIMQGLASLRVKTADGTEVEAKRGK